MDIFISFVCRTFVPQVDIDQDESAGAHLDLSDLFEAESVGTVVKEEDPIYISSDSDSEDTTQTSIAVSSGDSLMDISNRAETAKRHCVDVSHVVRQLRYPPPVVTYVAPQPCFTVVPPSNPPPRPMYTPVPPYLRVREDPPERNTALIPDQSSLTSSCWQIVRISKGIYVVCPLCKSRVKSVLLLEHMREHQHQTTEWHKLRLCQLCVDQGDFSKRVAPEHMWSHVLSRHKGHFPSSPTPQPSTRTTTASLPLQPKPKPMPTSAVSSCWQFVEKNVGEHWVICPYPPKCQIQVKPHNLAKHMKKVHKVNPESKKCCRLLCQGCKLAVPHGELSAHITCQKLPSTSPRTLPGQVQDPEWANWIRRAQLKRKASTPA